jgi:hypothetical protein
MHASFQSVQAFSEIGGQTADFIGSARTHYLRIKDSFGKSVVFVIAVIGVFVLRAILWWLIRRLKKNSNTNFNITPNTYKDLKAVQTDLASKLTDLDFLNHINQQELPSILSGLFNQLNTAVSLIENYKSALDKQLAKLDELDTCDMNFKVISESTLWALRTPHYEYRF